MRNNKSFLKKLSSFDGNKYLLKIAVSTILKTIQKDLNQLNAIDKFFESPLVVDGLSNPDGETEKAVEAYLKKYYSTFSQEQISLYANSSFLSKDPQQLLSLVADTLRKRTGSESPKLSPGMVGDWATTGSGVKLPSSGAPTASSLEAPSISGKTHRRAPSAFEERMNPSSPEDIKKLQSKIGISPTGTFDLSTSDAIEKYLTLQGRKDLIPVFKKSIRQFGAIQGNAKAICDAILEKTNRLGKVIQTIQTISF
jgi:hypothetical protein